MTLTAPWYICQSAICVLFCKCISVVFYNTVTVFSNTTSYQLLTEYKYLCQSASEEIHRNMCYVIANTTAATNLLVHNTSDVEGRNTGDQLWIMQLRWNKSASACKTRQAVQMIKITVLWWKKCCIWYFTSKVIQLRRMPTFLTDT